MGAGCVRYAPRIVFKFTDGLTRSMEMPRRALSCTSCGSVTGSNSWRGRTMRRLLLRRYEQSVASSLWAERLFDDAEEERNQE